MPIEYIKTQKLMLVQENYQAIYCLQQLEYVCKYYFNCINKKRSQKSSQ
jgi:hypothetical protein